MCLYKSPVGAEQTETGTQMRSEIFLQVQGMEKWTLKVWCRV